MPAIDRERVEETADVIMLVGSFGLVLSFLAPWADVVIGSRGRGYMDTWGLAGSGHIALFLLALGVLALAALQNPIGRWLRTGVAGVALGAFVLGLAWPYVVGPLGAGPGALLGLGVRARAVRRGDRQPPRPPSRRTAAGRLSAR